MACWECDECIAAFGLLKKASFRQGVFLDQFAQPRECHETVTANSNGSLAGGALVLVVERDPHVRDLESFFLNEAGFTVDFAEDGESAWTLTQARKPAIIVTEVMVPKLDGLALCRKVKSDPALSGTAVLIFSILAAHSRARDAGADAFLMKPLAERRLVLTVRDLLEKQERVRLSMQPR